MTYQLAEPEDKHSSFAMTEGNGQREASLPVSQEEDVRISERSRTDVVEGSSHEGEGDITLIFDHEYCESNSLWYVIRVANDILKWVRKEDLG